MLTRVGNWMDERMGWRSVWEGIFLRKVPRVNWFYTLGSATLFVAVNQIITGILLTIYYVPTPDHAYDSVQYITTQISTGWLIRGLHHWGASAMVVLVGLHMLRVILYGAYKYPREITWLTGVALLLVFRTVYIYDFEVPEAVVIIPSEVNDSGCLVIENVNAENIFAPVWNFLR